MADTTERILCISSYEKGQEFIRQCAELGVKPTLLTVEKLRDADWPRDVIEDLAIMPADLTREQIVNTVAWMARGRRFHRVVALDEFDLEAAAALREHMRIPGMGITTSGYYRDKLAMRTAARESGFLVPPFCPVLNYDELRAYMNQVPGPWLLKPRAEASALGIRKIEAPEQLWRNLEELGDRQSYFLLEKFIPGDIFHVDSIVSKSKVVFSVVHQYGRPPMQVMHEGGVFTTRTVERASREWRELSIFNSELAPSLGMVRGITHAEYIRAHADGRFYFLEIAARVGEDRGGLPARAKVLRTGGAPRVRRQRAVSGHNGRAGYLSLRCPGDRLSHEKAPSRGAHRPLGRFRASAQAHREI